MLLAGANTAGGQSTLGTVTTLFILVLAVAGAAVLLGWAARRLKDPGRRPRSTTTGLAPALVTLVSRQGRSGPDSPSVRPGTRTLRRGVLRPPPPTQGLRLPVRGRSDPNERALRRPHCGTGRLPGPARREPPRHRRTRERGARPRRLSRSVNTWTAADAWRSSRSGWPLWWATLPPDRWLVERYVMFAGHRVPFLILGETGVFALWAVGGQPRWSDIPAIGADGGRSKEGPAGLHRQRADGHMPVACSRRRATLVVPARRAGHLGDGLELGDPVARALRA